MSQLHVADAFDAYASIAGLDISNTERAGRYKSQMSDEKRILADVLAKLEIGPEHDVLDIGCGVGQLLIPLSFVARRVTGIDNPPALEHIKSIVARDNIALLPGPFPLRRPDHAFDRIVVYSVIQYMPDMKHARAFLSAALESLAPGGRMLIGDLPNRDLKARFMVSRTGAEFDRQWRAAQGAAGAAAPGHARAFAHLQALGGFSDDDVLELVRFVRANGCHAHSVSQPRDLPYGNTREDIVVQRPH